MPEKRRDLSTLARFHFIAGLPASGLRVLVALLDEDPRFVARYGGPAAHVFARTCSLVGKDGEDADLFDEAQRIALMRSAITAVHHDRPPGSTVFDANRDWLDHVDELVQLFPLCRFIVCVRNPAHVVNSIELSSPISTDQESLAKSVHRLVAADGLVGREIARVRAVLSGPHAERVFLLDYDRLADDPEEVMTVLRDFLRAPPFVHDYADLGRGMGAALGLEGPVARRPHTPVLPVRLSLQLSGKAFWRNLRRTSATMMLGRGR